MSFNYTWFIEYELENYTMEWHPNSEDLAPSLFSAIKNPTGAWKSRKQGAFMMSQRFDAIGAEGLSEIGSTLLEYQKKSLKYRVAGEILEEACAFLDANPESFLMELEGRVRWAEGRRGLRHVSWCFICDKYGVARAYKLAFKYSSDALSHGVDHEGATALFARDEGDEFQAWKGQVEADEVAAREAKEQAAREREARKAQLQFVGEVKKRMELELKLESLSVLDGYYGYTFIYRFRDAQGNALVWFASSPFTQADEEAYKEKFTKFKFTVKEHQDHETYGKNTLINRVVAVE